jgi:hypothetical protein
VESGSVATWSPLMPPLGCTATRASSSLKLRGRGDAPPSPPLPLASPPRATLSPMSPVATPH